MDEIDRKIIELLCLNGSMPNVKIAKKVGLSEGSVRKRIKRMIKEGVIKKFTIEVKEGEKLSAITFIVVEPTTPIYEVAKKIKKLKEVEVVYEITGKFDLAVVLSADKIDALNSAIDKIRNFPHIKNTDTKMILKVW